MKASYLAFQEAVCISRKNETMLGTAIKPVKGKLRRKASQGNGHGKIIRITEASIEPPIATRW
jgi:hypothetical protein